MSRIDLWTKSLYKEWLWWGFSLLCWFRLQLFQYSESVLRRSFIRIFGWLCFHWGYQDMEGKKIKGKQGCCRWWTFSRVAFMSFGRKWTGHPHPTPHLLSFCPRTDCWWCSVRTGWGVEGSLRRRAALISAGPASNPDLLGHVSFWGFSVCDGVWTRKKRCICTLDCGVFDCLSQFRFQHTLLKRAPYKSELWLGQLRVKAFFFWTVCAL